MRFNQYISLLVPYKTGQLQEELNSSSEKNSGGRSWRAERAGRVRVAQLHAPPREAHDVGRPVQLGRAVKLRVAVPQVVCQNEDDVRTISIRSSYSEYIGEDQQTACA